MRHKSIMNTIVYEVAGHRFAITANEELFRKMKQYEPFLVKDATVDEVVFTLEVVNEKEFPSTDNIMDMNTQEGNIAQIKSGRIGEKEYYEFMINREPQNRLIISKNYHYGTVTLPNIMRPLLGLNRAVMLMYALSTAKMGTVQFHASVVEHHGEAYLFLGRSGTGKSTHSQLWIKNILGTRLVNDDCPVVRINSDGNAIVYGSPWSGKTPCYRNVSYPIRAIVDLDQAPHNKICRLSPPDAYATLIPSITGKRWDKDQADRLHATEVALIKAVSFWHLYCRPDEEAARLCFENVTNG